MTTETSPCLICGQVVYRGDMAPCAECVAECVAEDEEMPLFVRPETLPPHSRPPGPN